MDGEFWIEGNRLWISNPAHHPQRVEWLRFAPDTRVTPERQAAPHICYTTDDLEAEIAGKEIVSEPADAGDPPFARAAWTREAGLLVEYLQLYPGRQWFDDDLSGQDGAPRG